LRSGSTLLSTMPRRRDGMQRAMRNILRADDELVHSVHEFIDTMIDGG
jgi:hypothetical protein